MAIATTTPRLSQKARGGHGRRLPISRGIEDPGIERVDGRKIAGGLPRRHQYSFWQPKWPRCWTTTQPACAADGDLRALGKSKTCCTSRASTSLSRRPTCSRNTSATAPLPTSRTVIRYICSFYINEVHVYVRTRDQDTRGILAGKKVSFNTVGSAANLTGGIVFDRFTSMWRRSSSTTRSHLKRCEQARSQVVVHVTGKPTDLFAKF